MGPTFVLVARRDIDARFTHGGGDTSLPGVSGRSESGSGFVYLALALELGCQLSLFRTSIGEI